MQSQFTLFCFVLFFFFFNKSSSRDIRIKGTPRMTPTKYTFYHFLFPVNHILEPFSTRFLTLIPNNTNYTQTTNVPLVSFSPKPSSTSLSTVYTCRLFWKEFEPYFHFISEESVHSFKRGYNSRF